MNKLAVILSPLVALLVGLYLGGLFWRYEESKNIFYRASLNDQANGQGNQTSFSDQKMNPKHWDRPFTTLVLDLRVIEGELLTDEQQASMKRSIESTILRELLVVYPELAALRLEKMGDEAMREYKESLVRSWANTDPVAAYNWLELHEKLFTDDGYETMRRETLSVLARRAPNQAVQFLSSFSSMSNRDQLAMSLAQGWATINPITAFDALITLAECDISQSALNECYATVVRRYAQINPLDAAALVGELGNELLQKQLLHSIITNLGNESLHGAITWSTNLTNPVTRNEAIKQLSSDFGRIYPKQIAEAIITNQESY